MPRLFFLLSFSFYLLSSALAQNDSIWLQNVRNWQKQMNTEYADSAMSPLTAEDLAVFKELPFFIPDPSFCVRAIMELTPDAAPFLMKTSGIRTPSYRQYGILHFEIKGHPFTLPAYQRVEVLTTDDYADYLFVPFTDLTNGEETYIGGRYMDCKIQEDSVYVIDFNMAYNPYCAYNHKYSCPVPPQENFLNIWIEAGVKNNSH